MVVSGIAFGFSLITSLGHALGEDLIFADGFEASAVSLCEAMLVKDVGAPNTFAAVHGTWPGMTSGLISINSDISGNSSTSRYAALRFTNNTDELSSGSYFTTGAIGGGGLKIFAISTCEGDFAPPDPDCVVAHASGSLQWNTGPKFFGRCPLQAGETYYINIAYAASFETLLQSTCANANGFLNSCNVLVEQQALNINP